MTRFGSALAGLVFACTGAVAAESDIVLPKDGDEYSALVARAQAHDDSVDFHALRVAYLKSAAFRRGGLTATMTLTKDMVAAARQDDGMPTVRAKAEQILSIDYTDLLAQKLLRQSCALLHDDACAELHHFVEFGLLRSITNSGDGKSCAAGWEAVQVKEEYFVLNMMDATVMQQALVSEGGHTCDAMTVTDDKGATQTWYFNIDRMMAAEQEMLGGGH